MTTDLDRAVRSSLGDILATAPEPDDQPMRLVTVDIETTTRRPYLAVAASLVVLAGVGALIAISTNDATPSSPAAAPETADDSSTAVATTTTTPGDTTSSVLVKTTPRPSCVAGAQALVPNVAGMPWADAAAVLATAGLEPLSLPELPAPLNATDPDLYVIIRQATAPGTITSCGTIVDITVAYQPGILHIVQDGDTYESIAASQGVTLDQLLGFNGLSAAELEASDRNPAAPLALGQALRLSECLPSNAPAPEACSGPSSDLDTVPTSPGPATTTTMP